MPKQKQKHIIYDWLPEEGKDTAMTSALERYENKRQQNMPGGYDRIARELTLLATDTDVKTVATLKAESKPASFFGLKKPKKALAKVEDDTVVVIIAHGSDKRHVVGYVADKKQYRISAQGLADMLRLDGLPIDHKYIKLNSCYAAGGHGMTLDETFAQQLAKELGTAGYKGIRVGGYQNALSSYADPNDKKRSGYTLTHEDGSSQDVRVDASGGRIWYDKDGGKIFTGKLSELP